jgi:hypothetical protein
MCGCYSFHMRYRISQCALGRVYSSTKAGSSWKHANKRAFIYDRRPAIAGSGLTDLCTTTNRLAILYIPPVPGQFQLSQPPVQSKREVKISELEASFLTQCGPDADAYLPVFLISSSWRNCYAQGQFTFYFHFSNVNWFSLKKGRTSLVLQP